MTHIILDTDDREYAESVAQAVSPSTPVYEGLPWVDLVADHNAETHVFYGEMFDDDPQSRMIQLGLAASGTILLSNDTQTSSPLYAGSLLGSADRAKVYLSHAKRRSDFFHVDGLTYAGPVWQDPKNVLLLDSSVPDSLSLIHAILKDASPKWWPTVGFVRESTDDALAEMLNTQFYYSTVVYFSKSGGERLARLGRTEDIADASELSIKDSRLAIRLRSLTYRSDSFETVIETGSASIDTKN